GRHDAGGDRAGKSKRIADRDDPVTDVGGFFGKLHMWKIVAAVDLQEGKIAGRVSAHDPCLVDLAVVELDLGHGTAAHYMIIGDREAIRTNEETRALRCPEPMGELRHVMSRQRRCNKSTLDAMRNDCDHRRLHLLGYLGNVL